jgi:RNA polymerase sigma factor (sigma-70 family)
LDDFSFNAAYLVRLRDRDPSTLAHFCDFFYLPIRNRIRHKITRDRADDLTQEVFLAALGRIDAGEPQDPQKLPGYVFGICSNLIMQGWRHKPTDIPVDADLSILPDVKERADARLLRELDGRMVHRILEKLSARDRDAIHRVFFLQQDRKRAAREMKISPENLRLILCRALKRFRIEWDGLQ